MRTKKFLYILYILMIVPFMASAHARQTPVSDDEEFRLAVKDLVPQVKSWLKEIPEDEDIYDIVSFAYVNVLGQNRIPPDAWRIRAGFEFLKREMQQFLGIFCYLPVMPKEKDDQKNVTKIRKIMNNGHYKKTCLSLTLARNVFVDPGLDRSPLYVDLQRKDAKAVFDLIVNSEGFFIADNQITGSNAKTGKSMGIVGKKPPGNTAKKWGRLMAGAIGKAPSKTVKKTESVVELSKEDVAKWVPILEAMVSVTAKPHDKRPLGYYGHLVEKLKKREMSYDDLFKFDRLKLQSYPVK